MNGHTIGFHPQTQKLELHTKYIAPESTAEEVSFEWSHNRILSTVSKVRTTLNTACQSTWFHLNGSTKGFHPQTQKVELHQ